MSNETIAILAGFGATCLIVGAIVTLTLITIGLCN